MNVGRIEELCGEEIALAGERYRLLRELKNVESRREIIMIELLDMIKEWTKNNEAAEIDLFPIYKEDKK